MRKSIPKRALSMLVAVVLWTAAPLMACVPGLVHTAKSDCCSSMGMGNCGEPMMSGRCCELSPTNSHAALAVVYAPLQIHRSGALEQHSAVPPIAGLGMGQLAFLESPPADPSPGGLSVLRI
jgi:hypothetical protein